MLPVQGWEGLSVAIQDVDGEPTLLIDAKDLDTAFEFGALLQRLAFEARAFPEQEMRVFSSAFPLGGTGG